MRKPCAACGELHDILKTLAPKCLAAYVPATDEEIQAALDKGRRARIAFEEASHGNMPAAPWRFR